MAINAFEFFQKSSGTWRSQRTTHHLAFKRAEKGGSQIVVEALDKHNPKIIDLCKLHEIDAAGAIGGAYVNWKGTMQWDNNDGEQHEGETVFALVPDDASGRSGKMLRELGYAEIVPVVGRYEMDEEDGLILITEYETMSSRERFWFANDHTRVRTSTVKRFGGFSTATFCTETLISPQDAAPDETVYQPPSVASAFGW